MWEVWKVDTVTEIYYITVSEITNLHARVIKRKFIAFIKKATG